MPQTLPSTDLKNNPTGCCPVFDPAGWDDTEFSFSGLTFISVPTRSFLHVPLDMGRMMNRAQKAIETAQAAADNRYLMLSQELSMWKALHYILVTANVPGYQTTTIEGIWYASVFDGPFSSMGTWMKEIRSRVEARGATPTRHLAFYTTCPRCARVYNHNYVVLFAQIGD
ncbi:MAG: hypothetical protein JXK93_02620 [Sphaerochaetaceae bacterium]|nr:hypothetical protein [Sphaerochaetaceae bacterium]